MTRGFRQEIRESTMSTSVPDLGPAPVRNNDAGSLANQGGQLVRLPAEDFAPAGAPTIDSIFEITLAALGAGDIFEYQVPGGTILRIYGLGWGADDEAGLSVVTWTLFVNETPFNALVNIPAGVGSIEFPTIEHIHIPGEASVRIAASNGDNLTAYTYQLHVTGWLYSRNAL
jgi:hypothetical protein